VPLFAPRRTPAIATGPAVADAAPGSAPRRTLRTYAREAAALLLLASSLYWMLALSSFQGDPLRPEVFGDDWVGPVGAVVAGQTIGLFGLLAWLVPTELAALALPLLADRPSGFGIPRLAGNVVIAVVLSALVHVAFPETLAFGAMPVGGAVGELFGELMRGLFSAVGSYIVGLTVVGLILVARATFSFIDSAQAFAAWLGRVSDRLGALFAKLGAAWEKARAIDAARSESNLGEDPIITRPSEADALVAALSDMDGARDTAPPLLELHSAIVHESAPRRGALPLKRRPRVLLEKTLADYGVSGKVEEIHPGPTVTTFEVVARGGHEGLEGREPGRRPRARPLAQGAHRRADPGQEPHRLRDPERASASPVNLRELSRIGASRR
jgi:hypothetical protein